MQLRIRSNLRIYAGNGSWLQGASWQNTEWRVGLWNDQKCRQVRLYLGFPLSSSEMHRQKVESCTLSAILSAFISSFWRHNDCRFVSGFIQNFEDNYVKFEKALKSTLRIPARTNAPRKAKTKSLLENFLHVQSKSLKKKAVKSKKSLKWCTPVKWGQALASMQCFCSQMTTSVSLGLNLASCARGLAWLRDHRIWGVNVEFTRSGEWPLGTADKIWALLDSKHTYFL